MTVSSNISFLAQSTSQINRLNDLRATFDDLQRQVTTQKKADDYSGLGTDAINVQRLHNVKSLTEGYLKNIDTVSSRMTMMSQTMTQISKQGSTLLSSINLGGETSMDNVNLIAGQTVDFIRDLVNQQMDGRYLFAGSDTSAQPLPDTATLNANFNNQVTNWLSGSNTTTGMLATTDAFTPANLGLAPGLTDSGRVTARITDSLDIDYTVKADQPEFKDILNACAFLANLKRPDPSNGDVATQDDFNTALTHAVDVLTRGVQAMNTSTQQLSSKFDLVNSVKEHLVSDNDILQTQIDGIENVDPSTAIINMQALQNQLTASYQVTKIVGQLSLTNFM